MSTNTKARTAVNRAREIHQNHGLDAVRTAPDLPAVVANEYEAEALRKKIVDEAPAEHYTGPADLENAGADVLRMILPRYVDESEKAAFFEGNPPAANASPEPIQVTPDHDPATNTAVDVDDDPDRIQVTPNHDTGPATNTDAEGNDADEDDPDRIQVVPNQGGGD